MRRNSGQNRRSGVRLVAALGAVLVCGSLGCKSEPEVYTRGNDPWVIRATLDERPRMLILALHPKLWVAYDAERASLYRVAPEGVSFDGAVYNTHHGPQPITQGQSGITNRFPEPWHVMRGGVDERPRVAYLGHRFAGPHVTIRYALHLADGSAIEIEETPEVRNGATDAPELERKFTLRGVPAGAAVMLDINALELASLDDVRLTSKADELVGQLKLQSNGETSLVMRFPVQQAKAGGQAVSGPPGQRLIASSDCATCHNPASRTVGPSYTEIAERYKSSDAVIRGLAAKIQRGGADQWGDSAMVAHPTMSPDDARTIVEYILSEFDPGDAKGAESSHPLSGELAAGAGFDATKLTSGVSVEIFEIGHALQEQPVFPDDAVPNVAFVGAAPLFQSADSFRRREPSTGFVARLRGVLHVETAGSYDFRLQHSGFASFQIDDQRLIRQPGSVQRQHSPWVSLQLEPGYHRYEIVYAASHQEPYLALSWTPPGLDERPLSGSALLTMPVDSERVSAGLKSYTLEPGVPGRGRPLASVHPSFALRTLRPRGFKPMVGGIAFLGPERAVISVWEASGAVYELSNLAAVNPDQIVVKKIAEGLAEPLGLTVVEGQIYVLQKHELTRLIDRDGDHVIDDYETVSNRWGSTGNFHEFAFGLAYRDGYFYATLAIGIEPGGAAMVKQHPDRGRVMKIHRATGAIEYVARGLRTPNGVGFGVDGQLFVTDNEGDWLPANKLIHVRPGAFFGSFSVEPEITKTLPVAPPAVWLPIDQIANSPSEPLLLDQGTYAQQMLYADVTYGGLNRVVLHKVDGEYQGCALPFSQGFEAGLNRAVTGPDGAIYVGGIGNPGNWAQTDKLWYGFQRLSYSGAPAFEMLDLEAKSGRVDITFTEALRVGDGERPEDYQLKDWHYLPTADYGGPKIDEAELRVAAVRVAEDRKHVSLSVPALRSGKVVHVQLRNPPTAESGREIWATDAFCTINTLAPSTAADGPVPSTPVDNQLSEADRQRGTQLLFDGRSLDGWQGHRKARRAGWQVKDGFLTTHGASGADLVTRQTYGDFDLELEWKVEPGANGGVFYRVEDAEPELARAGLEMQVLDDALHPDGRMPMHRAGAAYDLFAPSADVTRPSGAINRSRIIVRGTRVEHWLNGHRVVHYDMASETFQRQLKQSKFSGLAVLGDPTRGRIGLQHHGAGVSFRNIKLRPL